MVVRHIASKGLLAFSIVMVLSGCTSDTGARTLPDIQSGEQSLTGQESEIPGSAEEKEDQEIKVSVWAGSLLPGVADGSSEEAQFIKPYGLCGTEDGSILVVDCYANLIRISTDDRVETLAGNADILDQGGYPLGEYLNGPNEKALLNRPRFAVVSQEGAVVFSDTGNHRIRIVLDGEVRLLAGDGIQGYQDGDFRSARFDTPSGVAIGADGTIYVADTLNHCIRMIRPDGMVGTLAGKPQQAGFQDGSLSEAMFCEPNDIELGPDGALYVVDKGNQRVRRIADEHVTTIAGSTDAKDPATGYIIGGYQDGDANQSLFQYPTGLCAAEDGTIYVADTGNNCIRAISTDGQVSTVAGTKMPGNISGPVQKARFNQPLDVYEQDGKLYVSDSYNHVVRMVENAGNLKGGDES